MKLAAGLGLIAVSLLTGPAHYRELAAEVRHGTLTSQHSVVLSALDGALNVVAKRRVQADEDGVARLALDSVPQGAVIVTAHVPQQPGLMSSLAWPRSEDGPVMIDLLETCESYAAHESTSETVDAVYCEAADNTEWFEDWLQGDELALLELAYLAASRDEDIPADWELKVQDPVVTKKKQPRYPGSARHHRISGYVLLQVTIGTNGRVSDPVVLRSDIPEGWGFRDSAIKAVRRWKYRPATFRGEPIEFYWTIMVHFKAQ